MLLFSASFFFAKLIRVTEIPAEAAPIAIVLALRRSPIAPPRPSASFFARATIPSHH